MFKHSIFFALAILAAGCRNENGLKHRFANYEEQGRFMLGWVSGSQVEAFDILSGKSQVMKNLPDPVYGAQFSADGSMLGETQRGIDLLSQKGTSEDWFSKCLRSRNPPLTISSSAISRNGNVIVLVVATKGRESALILSRGCQAPRSVAFGKEIRFPSLSGDGSKLVFEENGQIYALETVGGSRKLLRAGKTPALSPDGKNLAYLADGKLQILELERDKSKTVAIPGEIVSPIQWSPDEKILAVTSVGWSHSTLRCDRPKDLFAIEVSSGQYAPISTVCEGFPASTITWIPHAE